MSIRYSPIVSALLMVVGCAASASAQAADTPSLRDTLAFLTEDLASFPVGDAIERATALEVANAPFGSSAGGFLFKLDPGTGLKVRTTPTFGPAFAERAVTAGEGRVSFGANLSVATYDKLNTQDLERMTLVATHAPSSANTLTGLTSLVLSSETLVVSTVVGATDKLDISAAVPFVKVKLDGASWIENADNQVSGLKTAATSSSGLGDIAVGAKYRLLQFGKGPPDPGGVAVLVTTRLPTGSRENFRGLGITRVLGSALVSGGQGKLRPHANVGFEWWEKGLVVDTVTARHQVQYVAGVELGAGPKVTLLIDFLGRHVLGGGSVELQSVSVSAFPVFTAAELALATPKGFRKMAVAPGLKWNLKGTFVLALNALVSVKDNGLRDFFTPVVGLDWTF